MRLLEKTVMSLLSRFVNDSFSVFFFSLCILFVPASGEFFSLSCHVLGYLLLSHIKFMIHFVPEVALSSWRSESET